MRSRVREGRSPLRKYVAIGAVLAIAGGLTIGIAVAQEPNEKAQECLREFVSGNQQFVKKEAAQNADQQNADQQNADQQDADQQDADQQYADQQDADQQNADQDCSQIIADEAQK